MRVHEDFIHFHPSAQKALNQGDLQEAARQFSNFQEAHSGC